MAEAGRPVIRRPLASRRTEFIIFRSLLGDPELGVGNSLLLRKALRYTSSRSAGTHFFHMERATETLLALPRPALAISSVTAGFRLNVGFEGGGGAETIIELLLVLP